LYPKSVRVAVIQAASIMMDLEKTTQKAVELIRKVGSQGAKLVLFPEAFMSGYPWGLHFGSHVGGRTTNGRLNFHEVPGTITTIFF